MSKLENVMKMNVISHAKGAENPNFSQYNLVLSEIDMAFKYGPEDAEAYRQLRHLMEYAYSINTLDKLTDGLPQN